MSSEHCDQVRFGGNITGITVSGVAAARLYASSSSPPEPSASRKVGRHRRKRRIVLGREVVRQVHTPDDLHDVAACVVERLEDLLADTVRARHAVWVIRDDEAQDGLGVLVTCAAAVAEPAQG